MLLKLTDLGSTEERNETPNTENEIYINVGLLGKSFQVRKRFILYRKMEDERKGKNAFSISNKTPKCPFLNF